MTENLLSKIFHSKTFSQLKQITLPGKSGTAFGKSVLTNVSYGLIYWLLFFKNDSLKYATISQRRSFNSFSPF